MADKVLSAERLKELERLADPMFLFHGLHAELHGHIRAQQAEIDRLREALEMLYDKWENGDPCFENPEDNEYFLGNAFKLSYEEENQVIALLAKTESQEGK